MNKDEVKQKISSDEDFINSKKYDYSISKFIEANPKGVSDNIIASFLCITKEEVQSIYDGVVKKIRHLLKVDVD